MNRRVIRVAVSVPVMEQFLENGEKHYKVEHGLPKHADYAGAFVDENMTLNLFFTHPDFDEVGEGEWVPAITPMIINLGD